MSYTVSKTITVEYKDHVSRLVKRGDSYDIETNEVTRHKDVKVNVNVDTNPFDASVDDSARSLGTLTNSIVGFKAASVAAKKANEKAIVEHVSSGFLNMIEQNINMQNAGMEAEMHALAGELKQQCDELNHKHDVMNKDFNRIKSRYMDLFETINKEFRNRMQALIQPCFDFVEQVKKEQNRRVESELLSTVTTSGKESDSARIAIQVSKMKRNAEALINSSSRYIDDNRSLNRAVATFALDGDRNELHYAPVVIMAEQSDKSGSEATKIFFNPMMDVAGRADELIRNRQVELRDTNMSSDTMNRISEYFNQQLGDFDDGTPQTHRVAMQMKKLFEKSVMKTFA